MIVKAEAVATVQCAVPPSVSTVCTVRKALKRTRDDDDSCGDDGVACGGDTVLPPTAGCSGGIAEDDLHTWLPGMHYSTPPSFPEFFSAADGCCLEGGASSGGCRAVDSGLWGHRSAPPPPPLCPPDEPLFLRATSVPYSASPKSPCASPNLGSSSGMDALVVDDAGFESWMLSVA